MTLCVYALTTPPRGPLRLRGLEGERLRIVSVGHIGAVVGDLRRVPRATHDHLERYDAVMRRLSDRYASILPARFGTCLDSEELAFILRSRQQSFHAALRHVRGRAQMTVRIIDPPSRPLSGAPQTGTDYLRRRSAAASIPALTSLRATAKRWVRDERVEQRGRIATVYHLIPRGGAEAYRRAVVDRAMQMRLRAIVSGPFPPYAFAEW